MADLALAELRPPFALVRFLTPIRRQCNTLVMGPGGYRFGDYARLGLPLSIMVVLVAVSTLLVFWPLQ